MFDPLVSTIKFINSTFMNLFFSTAMADDSFLFVRPDGPEATSDYTPIHLYNPCRLSSDIPIHDDVNTQQTMYSGRLAGTFNSEWDSDPWLYRF